MPTLTLTDPVAHTSAAAGLIATNNAALRALLNSGLDGVNFASSPSTKVPVGAMGSGTPDSTTFLRGDGSWQTPGSIPTGVITEYSGISAPTGWLICDGASVSRTTYAALFAVVTLSKGTFTVTIASPGVFTLNGHGLVVGDAVYLTTSGALPTGLSANTTYYVSVVTDANTFRLSTTRGGADINTSGTQSGTHTLILAPHGVPDATNFLLPDMRGRGVVGKGTHADVDAMGENEGVAVGNRRGTKHRHTPHSHTFQVDTSGIGTSLNARAGSVTNSNPSTATTDGGSGVGTDPLDGGAYLVLNYIIKT